MNLTERFAIALKSVRESANLSQDELGQRASLDRTYVSQLERAEKSPTLTTIEKLSAALQTDPTVFLRDRGPQTATRMPADYLRSSCRKIRVRRAGGEVEISTELVFGAVNIAHDLADVMYSTDLDIARVLGMRNLSAFVGELLAAAIIRSTNGALRANPHQDGYPDLLLMDKAGKEAWAKVTGRESEKGPFSPFAGGGIEIKATCGSVPSAAHFHKRGGRKPDIGDTRIGLMQGYDWKAHHRDTNNLLGIMWDFIAGRPRIAALFYSSELTEADWGRIIQPREGGGRTTSVSIMQRSGIAKMYQGWLCVLRTGGYAEFLNRRQNDDQIPAS